MYIVATVFDEATGKKFKEYINSDYIHTMLPDDVYLKEHDVHIYYASIHMHNGDVYHVKRESYLDCIELIQHILDHRIARTDILTFPDDVVFRAPRRY